MFYLLDWFRSFTPLRNPLGFGAADFIEFALAASLLAVFLLRPYIKKIPWPFVICALLPVVLRLALLAHSPVPIPSTADDMSYLLMGDTLAHFRLSNPTHPLHKFFETVFVLQEPSYASIFPLGQGIFLALGQLVFRNPWAGVLLSESLFCGLCYWMLRGWVSERWAFAGGILAGLTFGPLNYWMNSYWGGAVSGIAGCLVFGALPRRRPVLLGLGLALQLLTRPYELIPLLLAVLLAKPFSLPILKVSIPLAAALALLLLHNHSVTGSFLTLPYQTSRYQYGVPTTFFFQPNPAPHRELTLEQQRDYEAQSQVHDRGLRPLDRINQIRFFLLPSLFLALPFAFRSWRALAVIALFALASSFYPYFQPHYVAAVACLFLLLAVAGLERLPQTIAVLLFGLAIAHFAIIYIAHASGDESVRTTVASYDHADFINWGDPEGRRVLDLPGKNLVFIRYSPRHLFREWVYNPADIDRAPLIRALDLGPAENRGLIQLYPDRAVWLLEPDSQPPRLQRYEKNN